MALLLSSTDHAIALADKAGTLVLVERASRFGDTFWAVQDEFGLIEVHLTREALDTRLAAIRAAAAPAA